MLVGLLAVLAALALLAAVICWRQAGKAHRRQVVMYEGLERITQAVHGTPDGEMIVRTRSVLEDVWRDVEELG